MVGCESHKIYSIYSLYTHKMALESHQIPMNPIVVSHDTVYVPIIINQPHLSKNYILICLMAKKSNANTNNGQNTIEQGCSQHPRYNRVYYPPVLKHGLLENVTTNAKSPANNIPPLSLGISQPS